MEKLEKLENNLVLIDILGCYQTLNIETLFRSTSYKLEWNVEPTNLDHNMGGLGINRQKKHNKGIGIIWMLMTEGVPKPP